MNINELIKKHKYTVKNRQDLEKVDLCGCFYCNKIYSPKEIKKWCDDQQTAICPYCNIDSVIKNPSQEDLNILHEYYFNDNSN